MSKKNKSSAKKSGKTSGTAGAAKKAVKPPAKKSVAKKAVGKLAKKMSKPVPAAKKKTAAKPVIPAKKAKTAPAKKTVAKKPVKTVKAKPVVKSKPAVKPAVKKTAPPKKAEKPAVKAIAKPVKAASKPVAKVAAKPEKNTAKTVVNEKAKAAHEIPKPVPVEALEDKPKKSAETGSKKSNDSKKPEVLAITNTIPVKVREEISASKIASISHSITNPVKKTDSYAIKPEKEPNGKFELEFVVHSSAEMLYEFLSTPSGLSEWFCDDLNIRNGIYTFIWNDQLQQARLLKTMEQQLVRFQWVDKTDGSYFEFRIQRDDLTNDISLIITDFADSVGDRESSKLLWNSQVEKLMHVIGSIF